MEKKWSTLHVCVKDYRNVLGNQNAFYKQIEELELWNHQKQQHLIYLNSLKTECTSVREVEHINTQIVQTIEEITRINETKVKNLTQYSSQSLINEEELHKIVRTVVDKNVLLVNSLNSLREEVEKMKVTIEQRIQPEIVDVPKLRTSQIYRDSPIVDAEQTPDFKKRLESAILFAGSKHVFECFVVGSQPLELKWLKNGEEIVSSAKYSIKHELDSGQSTLTIGEVDSNDNALFACRASNNLGMAETSAYLRVKGIYYFIC